MELNQQRYPLTWKKQLEVRAEHKIIASNESNREIGQGYKQPPHAKSGRASDGGK